MFLVGVLQLRGIDYGVVGTDEGEGDGEAKGNADGRTQGGREGARLELWSNRGQQDRARQEMATAEKRESMPEGKGRREHGGSTLPAGQERGNRGYRTEEAKGF
jgi:hypothetical protein